MECSTKWGVVQAVQDFLGRQELVVALDQEEARAVNYPELTGSCQPGDLVLMNTTAVSLRLGTGGWHYVLAVAGRERSLSSVPGHIMKLRYTPLQGRVLAVEEEASPHHQTLAEADSLQGLPVAVGSLHSMLPPLAWLLHRSGQVQRLVYLMSDGAALPLALSKAVEHLKEEGLLHKTITFGHAFGGDLEAVNIYSALLAAKYVLQADAAVVLMGPGVVGTGTKWGSTALEQGIFLNAVIQLGGSPVAIARLSSGDPRPRHQGLSHHTQTVLRRIVQAEVKLPLPNCFQEFPDWREQLAGLGHKISWEDTSASFASLSQSPLEFSTMGRGLAEIPSFSMGWQPLPRPSAVWPSLVERKKELTLVYGDLHIHLGRTAKGRPVKITASPRLTLENVGAAARAKGLQLLGLVDAASMGVLRDLEELRKQRRLEEVPGGGCLLDGITLFLGSEVEIAHKGKAAHFLAFFPTLEAAAAYSKELSPYLTNPSLSTQRLRLEGDAWLETVLKHSGTALAAHAFTPHKGVYGSCVHRLGEMFSNPHLLAGLELGLSATTELAQMISDTHSYAYLANSDAHSLGTIGREFTLYRLSEISFRAWQKALEQKGAGIVATYGLDPRLGKYYRSYCPSCHLLASQDGAVLACPQCRGPVTMGVWDRIQEIADVKGHGEDRPPYRAHVPLTMLPGVGPRTYRRLLGSLGSEIEILHELPLESIAEVGGERLSQYIRALRLGQLTIQPGGGGIYGKVQGSLN